MAYIKEKSCFGIVVVVVVVVSLLARTFVFLLLRTTCKLTDVSFVLL
jgi:hypothetical protein